MRASLSPPTPAWWKRTQRPGRPDRGDRAGDDDPADGQARRAGVSPRGAHAKVTEPIAKKIDGTKNSSLHHRVRRDLATNISVTEREADAASNAVENA